MLFGHDFDPRWSGCCTHRSHDHFHAKSAERQEPVEVFDEHGRPVPALIPVLETIARQGCRLATGHLSAREIRWLVPLALEIGVPAIILTHPHYPSVALGDSDLRLLCRHSEVFVEHCMAIHTIEGVPLDDIARAIRATGPEQVVLSTDFGQIMSDPFPDGTIAYASALAQLLKGAISRADLVRMFSANGRRALGLSRETES